MLGVAAFPSLLYTVMCFGLPESPRWLIGRKGDREAGLKVLRLIEPEPPQAQLEAEADEILAASSERRGLARFWTRQLRIPILLAVLIAFFNQLSGINAVLYFAPRIFELTGLGAKAALLQSVGIGVTNLIFTFVGLWLIDRLGRRTLLYIGSFGYILSLGLTAWAFFTAAFQHRAGLHLRLHAAHAVGQGAVIWVFISEIFPNRHRAEGQALGSFTHWIFAALLTTFFPEDGDGLCSGICVPLLLRHDGAAACLGEVHGARNQGSAAGSRCSISWASTWSHRRRPAADEIFTRFGRPLLCRASYALCLC